MTDAGQHLSFLRHLGWDDLVLILAVLVGWRLVTLAVRGTARWTAEHAPPRRRLMILRISPLARLAVSFVAIAILVPLLIEPNFADIVALLATVGIVLAFAVKDYASALLAGVVTIVENTYQPGDWIELDGSYGEVMSIGVRAVYLRTIDDREVVIPHSRLWSSGVVNVSRGRASLVCRADFYLHADHDGAAVRQALAETAEASGYRLANSAVRVAAAELPWGTRYRVLAHVAESRQQFAMVTDLTLRGKERLRAMRVTFAQAPYAAERRA